MRRVLAFFKWKSRDWLQKGNSQIISSLATCPLWLKGLRAYAYWQVDVFASIHNRALSIWKGLEIPPECLTEPFYPANLSLDTMELDGDDT